MSAPDMVDGPGPDPITTTASIRFTIRLRLHPCLARRRPAIAEARFRPPESIVGSVVIHADQTVARASAGVLPGPMKQPTIEQQEVAHLHLDRALFVLVNHVLIDDDLRRAARLIDPGLLRHAGAVASDTYLNRPVFARRWLEERRPCLHESTVRNRVENLLMPAVCAPIIMRRRDQASVREAVQRAAAWHQPAYCCRYSLVADNPQEAGELRADVVLLGWIEAALLQLSEFTLKAKKIGVRQ